MYPSQIRNRILHEHGLLRHELQSLETHVHDLERDSAELEAVAAEARRLLIRLSDHTRLEDALLAPVLRDTDSWGPKRADTLLEHHELQRAQLAELLATSGADRDALRMARVTLDLISEIRADMQHEEQEILTRNLLRDDLVTADTETG